MTEVPGSYTFLPWLRQGVARTIVAVDGDTSVKLRATAKVEHEATTSRIAEDQLFYCRARGLNEEEAVGLIVNGFCREVLQALPMEFAIEAQKLVAISLEGSVG